jgi:hypothetical protein
MLSTEQGKAAALFEFYDSLMGVPAQRTMSINLDILGLPWLDLSSLADRFTRSLVQTSSPVIFCSPHGRSSVVI